jgi:hypothetical protein
LKRPPHKERKINHNKVKERNENETKMGEGGRVYSLGIENI